MPHLKQRYINSDYIPPFLSMYYFLYPTFYIYLCITFYILHFIHCISMYYFLYPTFYILYIYVLLSMYVRISHPFYRIDVLLSISHVFYGTISKYILLSTSHLFYSTISMYILLSIMIVYSSYSTASMYRYCITFLCVRSILPLLHVERKYFLFLSNYPIHFQHYSTVLLLPLRFYSVCRCWDRTRDCCTGTLVY